MFERILLPLDGSALAEGIIPYVRQIARGFQSELTLIFVKSPGGQGNTIQGPRGTEIDVQAHLAEVRQRLAEGGVQAQAVTVAGGTAEQIVLYATEKGYRLIAMATHGRSGLGRWVYGSTADKVLHSTGVPLLLIRPADQPGHPRKQEPFQTLVVPLDGSELGESVLPYAEALATRLAVEIVLVRVVPFVAALYGGSDPLAYDPKLDQFLESSASGYLEKHCGALKGRGVQARLIMLRGHPASQIIDLAEEAGPSLIVMSTHGRSGVGRWVMGSVADRVLRASHRPVLLIPYQGKTAVEEPG